MKILVTGSAGFIGFHLSAHLLKEGHEVVGIDNINDYYTVELKYGRLAESGISRGEIDWHKTVKSEKYPKYRFIRMNLEDKHELMELCYREKFDTIINLAAQAGVRYSIDNPDAYIQSNVVGFINILEACRHTGVGHLVYASSSSVYGKNETMPFSTSHNVDHPISLYAATKKANELMAHTYSHLYNIPTTGLRFFTVYGPWGRPDMAYFLFARSISNNEPIKVFNHGKMKRDFTYVDDVVKGIASVLPFPAEADSTWSGKKPNPSSSSAPYQVYNLGNNKPVELMSFIKEIEKHIGKPAKMEFLEMQDGDVPATWADIDTIARKTNYNPSTTIEEGIRHFATWYKKYTV